MSEIEVKPADPAIPSSVLRLELPGPLLDKLTPEKTGDRGTLTLDAILKFAQAAAIIGAATWTVFEYLDFRRDSQALDVRQKQLDNRNKELAQNILELERQAKGIEVKALSQAPLTQSYELAVVPFGSTSDLTYKMTLRIKIKNNSKHELHIDEGEMRLYMGQLKSKPIGQYMAKLNSPFHSGPINWEKMEETQYVSIRRSQQVAPPDKPEFGGLAYGRLLADETFGATYSFLVKVKTADLWLGYSTSLHTNSEGMEPWLYENSDFVLLKEEIGKRTVPRISTPRAQ